MEIDYQNSWNISGLVLNNKICFCCCAKYLELSHSYCQTGCKYFTVPSTQLLCNPVP